MFTSNQPHTPWNRGDKKRYRATDLVVPPNMVDTKLTRERMADYFSEITYLDSLVGACLDIIERSGKKQNTIVIFASEQGSSFPFSKWTLYDQGLRSAFIVRWPDKVLAGARSSAMAQYTDILPTLLEIAGADPQAINTGSVDVAGNSGFDGSSFRDVLIGKQNTFRKYVYGVNTTRGIHNGSAAYASRSVRDEDYLYIENLNYKEEFSNVVTGSPLFRLWLSTNKNRASQYIKRPRMNYMTCAMIPGN
ncbi:sulfatase-like hydrolase/transferase [Niabella hibiscisoli]|nr:sulfatase-like hydrolase/transferase [Niabella hibiscisoli]